MISAIAIDFGMTFAFQSSIQTAADAAALAGAAELVHNTSPTSDERLSEATTFALDIGQDNLDTTVGAMESDDIIFGYVDPSDPVYDKSTFRASSSNEALVFTNGYNAVWARVRANEAENHIPSIAANLFGKHHTAASAHAVALMDSDIGSMTGGLRPIYGCVEQYKQAVADGNITNDVIRVYGDEFRLNGTAITQGCPPPGAGNWGFSDLRDSSPGAPGNSTLSRWWLEGYGSDASESNPTVAGNHYSTQSGNSINSESVTAALDYLRDNKVVISIPLIDMDYTGNGTETKVHVVGFVGMVITSYQAEGNDSYVEGYMTNAVCANNCQGGNDTGWSGTGMAKLKLIH